jgi:hypothetical protein
MYLLTHQSFVRSDIVDRSFILPIHAKRNIEPWPRKRNQCGEFIVTRSLQYPAFSRISQSLGAKGARKDSFSITLPRAASRVMFAGIHAYFGTQALIVTLIPSLFATKLNLQLQDLRRIMPHMAGDCAYVPRILCQYCHHRFVRVRHA